MGVVHKTMCAQAKDQQEECIVQVITVVYNRETV